MSEILIKSHLKKGRFYKFHGLDVPGSNLYLATSQNFNMEEIDLLQLKMKNKWRRHPEEVTCELGYVYGKGTLLG